MDCAILFLSYHFSQFSGFRLPPFFLSVKELLQSLVLTVFIDNGAFEAVIFIFQLVDFADVNVDLVLLSLG